MGADHLYRIDCSRRPDPWEKSLALAHTIKDLTADLVLCGKESIDTQNGQVGALVAHHLKIPFVSAITNIKTSKDNIQAIVRRSCGRGVREESNVGYRPCFLWIAALSNRGYRLMKLVSRPVDIQ